MPISDHDQDKTDGRRASMDALREARRAYDEHGSTYEAAKALGIGQSTLCRRLRRLGSLRVMLEARAGDMDELTQYMQRHPATTLHKLQDAASDDFAAQVNAILSGELIYVTIPKEV